MAKLSREQAGDEVRERIKGIARSQMAAEGTAGVSLRAIARELDVTAPALYRYYASRDDLLTALIVDAYNDLADALEDEAALYPGERHADKLYAVLVTYRKWALDNPVDFQLIFGNPVPGYDAPRDVTVPAARRPFELIGRILTEALHAGELKLPTTYQALPPSILSVIQSMMDYEGYDLPPEIIYLTTAGWAKIHGILMLELFTHIQPVIGDTEAFYTLEVRGFMESMGLHPTPTEGDDPPPAVGG